MIFETEAAGHKFGFFEFAVFSGHDKGIKIKLK